jgi:Holliday junction resolvase RusA-like endonuclease
LTPLGDHTTKLTADVDNLIKTTLDGLQGAAFENDRIVMVVTAVKQ